MRKLRKTTKGENMHDTLTALTAQLGKAIREHIDADKGRHDEMETMIQKYLAPHINQTKEQHNIRKEPKRWAPPETIAFEALDIAKNLENTQERDGQLHMLAVIATAIHRQAEALETTCDQLEKLKNHVRTWLPSPREKN